MLDFPMPQFRVLIAEDDKVSARILQNALATLGHSWVSVADGGEAWEAIRNEPFAVVITDWIMPGLEGPELCRKIRGIRDRDYCYVLLVSSKDQRADHIAALEAGGDDFLTKPIDREDLRARLAVAARILNMQARLERQKSEMETSSRIAEVSRNRFSQLFEGMPIACFTYDADCTVFEWNERAAEQYGFQPGEAIGRPVWALMGTGLVGTTQQELLRQVVQNVPFVDYMWSDGTRFVLASGLPLRGRDGSITGGILSAVDITRQKQAEELIANQLIELAETHRELGELNSRLAALATTDALTGIANHRAFHDRLAQRVQEAQRGRGFALAILDVDHFKRFNDEFGHQAGDQVLASVGATLKSNVGEGDFVARYGGEEFGVLFGGAGEAEAAVLCERLRTAIERIESPHRRITASFGVAAWDRERPTAPALIQCADAALYRAKAAGRNRVVRATPSTAISS